MLSSDTALSFASLTYFVTCTMWLNNSQIQPHNEVEI